MFYRHFESKDELFLAMLRQESDTLACRLDRIVDGLPDVPADQLRAWIGHMFGCTELATWVRVACDRR